MSNKYKHGRYRIAVAGNPELQNKPIVITDEEGNDVLDNAGTSYTNLRNKPKINGVVLTGDKSSAQLGLPKVYVVDDITTLDGDFLDNLHSGDVVVETDSTSGYSKTFVVAFYAEDEVLQSKNIHLTYDDGGAIEGAEYSYGEEGGGVWAWVFNGRSYDYLSEKANKIYARTTQPQYGMNPNTLYNLGTLTSDTTFTMAAAYDNTIANHWYWTFETGSTAPTITWPAAILEWADGSAPTISASKHYEISVLGGVACVLETDITTSN